ncbi:hypothetical protein ACI5KX_02915 [Erythrobacter sp. GH1-10]|uniref:hypothetical protein n=1 Tax=Erythrobacter sp. GH1-10 TaxID=3349334 RepID=UPI003877BABB
MSKSFFEQSKGALIFAGVTVFGAAVFAASMGDRGPMAYIPGAPEAEPDRGVVEEKPAKQAEPQPSVFSDYVSDEELSFSSFAEEEELVDNTDGASTAGFSTSPGQEMGEIISSGGSEPANPGPASPKASGRRPPPGPIKRADAPSKDANTVQPKKPVDTEVF